MRNSASSRAFSEEADESSLVVAAQAGDRAALNELLRRHQPWIFNLALRMVWRHDAAEDATQEVLLKAVAHLGAFEGRSKFSTWLYRMAVNHLLNVKKSEMEEQRMTFSDLGHSLDGCADSELPDEATLPIGHGLLVEEAKLGCMTAMLMCLDRRQRLAFILGEIFGCGSETGGAVMEVSADNFRQLLSRARRDLYHFMQDKCGLVNPANPCRCAKKAGGVHAERVAGPAAAAVHGGATGGGAGGGAGAVGGIGGDGPGARGAVPGGAVQRACERARKTAGGGERLNFQCGVKIVCHRWGRKIVQSSV